ncbi:hypothetical protein BJ878DRAFT_545315 [Calycina marina]|uniref:AMP-activated protein kinase glycogen-binding domain-containing protein n=1 Tax=Calycina marina TaxID=1763456 RepID=A0A9P7YWN3_9HELO|nr:hypothetical protein BJ878DRAFT_545315 [Calycina marina]
MAPSVVVLRYVKPGTKPPIYLAGDFSSPEWLPLPMEWYSTNDGEYEFHKDINVLEGQEYQYKFRVGEGEWWTLDENAPTVTDNAGNTNNVLKGPFKYKEETNKDLETPDRPLTRLASMSSEKSRGNSNLEEVKRQRQSMGGGDGPSPVENTPMHSKDDQLKEPEHLRENNDVSPTPSQIESVEMANTAAEVADVAAALGEPKTSDIADTTAKLADVEVAKTAAEVADVAATLDKPQVNIDHFDEDDDDDHDSLADVPRFSYECDLPLDGEPMARKFSAPREAANSRDDSPYEKVVYDPNDPSIEEFPVGREAIYELIRRASRNMKEDEVAIDLQPASSVVGANPQGHTIPSPHMLPNRRDERTASLDSIPEEHGSYREGLLASLPKNPISRYDGHDEAVIEGTASGVDSSGPEDMTPDESPNKEAHISAEPMEQLETTFIESDAKQLGGDGVREVEPEVGPSIIITPATTGPGAGSQKPETATASAVDTGNGQSKLKQRNTENVKVTDRPLSSASSKPSAENAQPDTSESALQKFFSWIGHFFARICGGKRKS